MARGPNGRGGERRSEGEWFLVVGDLDDRHALSVRCPVCGRTGLIAGGWLRARRAPGLALAGVASRVRCSGCGTLGTSQWSVTLVPGEL